MSEKVASLRRARSNASAASESGGGVPRDIWFGPSGIALTNGCDLHADASCCQRHLHQSVNGSMLTIHVEFVRQVQGRFGSYQSNMNVLPAGGNLALPAIYLWSFVVIPCPKNGGPDPHVRAAHLDLHGIVL